MCLMTKDSTLYTTEKDITVYKLLSQRGNNFFSEFYDFEYEPGVLYEQEFSEGDIDGSYYDEEAGVNDDGDENYPPLYYSEGFHFAFEPQRFNEVCKVDKDLVLKEFILPAGTLYRKDETGLGISNQIKLK